MSSVISSNPKDTALLRGLGRLRKRLCAVSIVAVCACGTLLHAQTPANVPIYKIVTYKVPLQNLAAFLTQCSLNAEATRKEAGTLNFQVLQPIDSPDTVLLLEEYKNQSASESHSHTAHFLAFMRAVQHSGATRTALVAAPLLPNEH